MLGVRELIGRRTSDAVRLLERPAQ